MGPLDEVLARAMATDLARRLGSHQRALRQGQDFGDIPVASGFLEAVTHPARAALDTIGLAAEGADEVAKAATGAGMAALSLADRARLVNLSPENRAHLARILAAGQGQANPWSRARAINEEAARGNEFGIGLLNTIVNPTNLAGVGSSALAAKAPKLAAALRLVDEAQALPLRPVGAAAGKVARTLAPDLLRQVAERGAARAALDPAAAENLANTRLIGEAGNVRRKDLPLVAGKRQVGPAAPAPPPPPSTGVTQAALPPESGVLHPPLTTAPRAEVPPTGPAQAALPPESGRFHPPLTPAPRAGVAPARGRWTPEERAIFAADPEVQRLEAMIAAAKTSTGGTVIDQVSKGSGRPTNQKQRSLKGLGFQLSAARKKALENAATPGPQLALPPESGTIPAHLADLDPDARQLLADLATAVERGDRRGVALLRDQAADPWYGIAPERVDDALTRGFRRREDLLAGQEGEARAAALAAIESGPYYPAFRYFAPNSGELIRRNPKTGRPIAVRRAGGKGPTRDEIWNIPGSGYDEVADSILARFADEGHNQNFGQTSDDFWRAARDAYAEYRGLKKPETPDLAGQEAALRALLAGGDQGLGITPRLDDGRARAIGDLAPALPAFLRKLLRDPGGLDPARLRAEALANEAADDIAGYFASNWPTLRAGNLSRDELVAAFLPTRLSIRRGPIGERGIEKLTSAYPDLAAPLAGTAIRGGADAGKYRPEDVVGQMIAGTDEGRALARAIRDGDRAGLAAALPRFKAIWPGSLMEHEQASFWDAANKLGQATDFINERAAADVAPGDIVEGLIAGAGDYAPIKGVARGKVPFMAGQIGLPAGTPTFDSKVKAILKPSAGPLDYKALLTELYPWAKDDLFRAHQYFWDAVQRDAGGVGAQTPHSGLRAAQEAARGGLGLLPSLATNATQVGAAGTAGLLGAGAGEVIGGALPADSPEEREANRARGAQIGGGLGLAAGVAINPRARAAIRPVMHRLGTNLAALADDTLLDGGIVANALREGAARFAASKGAKGARGGDILRGADAQWRTQVTTTLRNLLQNAIQIRLLVTEFGGEFGRDAGDVRAMLGHLDANRANPDPVARYGDLGQWLGDAGIAHLIGGKGGAADLVGESMAQNASNAARQSALSAPQRAIVGATIGAANGAARLNPISPAFGAARGYFTPFIDGTYRYLEDLQQSAPRVAFLAGALDRDMPLLADEFLANLASRGVNTAALASRGGRFAAGDVEALVLASQPGAAALAKQAGADWAALAEALVRRDGDQVAKLFGDFRDAKTSPGTRIISRVFPFTSWAIKSAPTLARIAARHPIATANIIATLAEDTARAKREGRKGYTVGTVPVSTETPLVGGLARARLGGQAGTLRLDPLALLSPLGGEFLMGQGAEDDDATLYQRGTELLGRAGASVHPLGQAAAYVAGQDYKGPGALSRTAGVEGLANLIPGMPELGGGGAALDTARRVVEPILAEAGVHTTGPTGEFDPVSRRYAELVLDATGKVLSDPSNRVWVEGLGDEDNPLWARAMREVTLAQAAGNAFSLASPVSASAEGADAAALRQDRAAAKTVKAQAPSAQLIFDLNASSPGTGTRLAQSYAARHPELARADAYRGASPSGRDQALGTLRGPAIADPALRRAIQRQLIEQAARRRRE